MMLCVNLPSDPRRWWLMCPPPGVELTMTTSPGPTNRLKTASLALVPLIGRTSQWSHSKRTFRFVLRRVSISSM